MLCLISNDYHRESDKIPQFVVPNQGCSHVPGTTSKPIDSREVELASGSDPKKLKGGKHGTAAGMPFPTTRVQRPPGFDTRLHPSSLGEHQTIPTRSLPRTPRVLRHAPRDTSTYQQLHGHKAPTGLDHRVGHRGPELALLAPTQENSSRKQIEQSAGYHPSPIDRAFKHGLHSRLEQCIIDGHHRGG